MQRIEPIRRDRINGIDYFATRFGPENTAGIANIPPVVYR